MPTSPSANEITGRAIGALFFAGFGTIWIILALYVRQMMTTANLSVVVADLALLLVTALWLMRKSKLYPRVDEDPAQAKAFNRINGIQWIAVAVVAFSFARLHLDPYVLSAITLIVGLHMFPLARLFSYRMHYATGAALVIWAVASVLLAPVEQLQGTTALGTGILLWASAWVTLALAIRAARPAGSARAERQVI